LRACQHGKITNQRQQNRKNATSIHPQHPIESTLSRNRCRSAKLIGRYSSAQHNFVNIPAASGV